MPDRPRTKRPSDVSQRAKLIVDIATGAVEDKPDYGDKNPASVEGGRVGGKKGGNARSLKLSPEQRSEIARLAAQARWKKSTTPLG